MADLLYLRHSTDKQTNPRQRHALDAYLSAGARAFEDPATSSHVHPLHRPGFRDLLEVGPEYERKGPRPAGRWGGQ